MAAPKPNRKNPSAPADSGKRPNLYQVLESDAEHGDFESVVSAILHAPPGELPLRQCYYLLRYAVELAAYKKPPEEFTAALYRNATAFAGIVSLRLQAVMTRCLYEADTRLPGTREHWPAEMNSIWPQMRDALRLVAELSQGWAATTRLWELSRRQQAKRPPRHQRKKTIDLNDRFN